MLSRMLFVPELLLPVPGLQGHERCHGGGNDPMQTDPHHMAQMTRQLGGHQRGCRVTNPMLCSHNEGALHCALRHLRHLQVLPRLKQAPDGLTTQAGVVEQPRGSSPT